MPLPVRQSTEADIEALDQVCERLSGFGEPVMLEWVDGYFAALLGSRRAIPPSEWLPALFGDDFDRAFADPQAVEQALKPLMARWNVLANQLDAESLLDEPDVLRLTPLILTVDDELRDRLVAEGQMGADEARDSLQTGVMWADGFNSAVEAFAADWPEPEADSEEAVWYDSCRMRISALLLPQADLATYLAEEYPGETLARDQLVDEACFAVQDLRVYWLEYAPKPETRRVGVQPGRNDPCPCGSGRKFKKCHGAT